MDTNGSLPDQPSKDSVEYDPEFEYAEDAPVDAVAPTEEEELLEEAERVVPLGVDDFLGDDQPVVPLDGDEFLESEENE
ncbi:MAG TPA: hypothetical protein VFE00_14420 [Arthrobacter sp.]|jgi:hypothetical protein|nr:hypothetical protein [Arthrobacter sp.]MDQ1623166.1 hypothetical protein [Actinomycetota bacterium]HET6271254.1 hypothetical protein [Arthrobacter sp.]